MQKNCEITKDLLPLYVDGLVSEGSREFVSEHISECVECMETHEKLKLQVDFPAGDVSKNKASNPFKKIQHRITKKLIKVSLISTISTAVLVFAIVLGFVYSSGDWMAVDRFFGIDPVSLISSDEQQNNLIDIFAKTENCQMGDVSIDAISHSYNWVRIIPHGRYSFFFLVTYRGEKSVVEVFAEQPFLAKIKITGYDWCTIDDNGILYAPDGNEHGTLSSFFIND